MRYHQRVTSSTGGGPSSAGLFPPPKPPPKPPPREAGPPAGEARLSPERRRASIAARLFLAVAGPAALVVVLLGVLAWRTTQNAVESSLKRELASSVAVAASSISPTAAMTMRAMVRESEAESRAYRGVVARLRGIQRSTGSVRVLVIEPETETVRGSADKDLHIGDAAPRIALDRVEIQRALEGAPAVSVPFTGDDGRRYMAAYAVIPEQEARDPSADSPGGPGGGRPPEGEDEREAPLVLAMEAPAAALDATDEVAKKIAGLVGLAVLGVFSLALVVARTITRPLLRLADETRRLGRGELSEPLALPHGEDEVAALGRTLESMRKALVDRDAERQMMLAGIAHEVRNPLGGMELFSGLLEEGIAELPEAVPGAVKTELLDQAGRVRKELRYLTEVVSSFLAFARETPLSTEPVVVQELLEDVASLCRREGMAPVLVEAEGAGSAEMDRGRIKQALLNLVENALAATPPEGRVVLSARREGPALVLAVEDSGKGMDAETLARVWQPFFTTKEKGSGLGLPLAKKLARDHRGEAEVRSVPGQGTRVTLTLPA
jgi:signal transduction histidine kinase